MVNSARQKFGQNSFYNLVFDRYGFSVKSAGDLSDTNIVLLSRLAIKQPTTEDCRDTSSGAT